MAIDKDEDVCRKIEKLFQGKAVNIYCSRTIEDGLKHFGSTPTIDIESINTKTEGTKPSVFVYALFFLNFYAFYVLECLPNLQQIKVM